ncbi:MAG TPA: TlpA disulfide reductase family protein [Pyrinomonadaceae bacterium]
MPMMKGVSITLLLLLIPVLAKAQTTPAPRMVLRDLNGRSFRLSDYKGKVVLLNFWATWCPPCRAEVPELVRWQKTYRRRGLQVIGVTYPPQKLAEVRRFVRREKINYPVGLGTKEMKLLFTQSESLPMTIVIGKDGRIRDIIEGILLPEEFEQKIKPLLE